MRSTIALLVFGTVLAVAAGPALAASSRSFSGDISKVDSAAKTLVVKARETQEKEMSFQVGPQAKIMMGGKALDLARLKNGEHVKVTYIEEGTRHEVRRIEVMAPKHAAAKPMSKPMTP